MASPTIQVQIQDCITEIAQTADRYPGVVIIHDLRDWSVAWMSALGLIQLGVTVDELREISSDEYHARHFNPDDAKEYVPKLSGLLERNNNDEVVTYFQQVRIDENADWTWHMSSTKILLRDNSGKPLLAITMSFAIDAMHHMTTKASRLLEENNFLRKNFALYTKLSQRERDILRFMAMGKSASETAAELFISVNTVETHRKNIRQKLNASSFFELTQYARAFDLI